MSKQRMIVTDDQLLIDMELLFNAIREVDGDWESVERDMYAYMQAVNNMTNFGHDDEEEIEEEEVAVEETKK